MAELHKKLSDTAIRLSVYSSVLDFGLTISVLLLQKNDLPAGVTGMLINMFDNAITYVTLLIVGLFGIAFVLKHKEHVVKIYNIAVTAPKKQDRLRKITVSAASLIPHEDDDRKAIMRVPVQLKRDDLPVERIVNARNESFIRFNGVWYKADDGRFEKVTRPDYE
ncbi:MAG: hypothetical protein M1348_01320 [Candidatus Parvarchaeota archaeon]|nr:hypothetical protein [Candidatus Parvarchaeota archaeon]